MRGVEEFDVKLGNYVEAIGRQWGIMLIYIIFIANYERMFIVYIFSNYACSLHSNSAFYSNLSL